MGELFACQKEELIALTLWRRILLCLEKLMIALGATLELSFEDIASRLIANEESAAEIIFLAKSLEQFHRERQVPKLA
jgi:hypothetical protein